MANHNLLIRRDDGSLQKATSQEVLKAARSVLEHRVRRGAPLQSPAKVGEYLTACVGHLDYEVFGAILLDTRQRVIECLELFRGTLDGATVHPREVVKIALLKGAASLVIWHNHPSGVQDQSTADELITFRLRDALSTVDVRLLDHLVLAGPTILSFASKGLL